MVEKEKYNKYYKVSGPGILGEKFYEVKRKEIENNVEYIYLVPYINRE